MTDERHDSTDKGPGEARALTPAAQRALAEAETRRKQALTAIASAKEFGGREGLDPARYGDWEVGGIISDF